MTHKYPIKIKAIVFFLCMTVSHLQAEISYHREMDLCDFVSQLRGASFLDNYSGGYTQDLRQTIPLDKKPYWSSQADGFNLWGVALVNITDDDYPEVITTYEFGYNYLYLNNLGVIDSTPSWQSNDSGTHMLPAFGDYDNDGDLDMAVAMPEIVGGKTIVYRNDSGMFTSDPVWTALSGGGFTCDWGDVDNDGDLDLAIADFWNFYPAVFSNNNGTLELVPSWRGTDYNNDIGVKWIDVDNDGDLDLAVGGYTFHEPTLRIYYNSNGILETMASWKSQITTDSNKGIGLSVWDVNQDGWLDMGVTGGWVRDNTNIIFMNLQDSLESYPSWFSNDVNNSGCCLFGDVNGDGSLDWVVNNNRFGAVYENIGTSIGPAYAWQSANGGGLGVDLGDVDLDGIMYREDTMVADGMKKLFYLKIIPIHKLEGITIDNNPVLLSDYCCNLKSGWISFKDSISVGSEIVFKYFHSRDMELLLSNQYTEKANLYKNTNVEGITEHNLTPLGSAISIYPNPVRRGTPTELTYSVAYSTYVQIDIYDCMGRKLETLYKQKINPGVQRTMITTQFSSGTYFLRLKVDKENIFTKIVIVE